jgi:NADH dehydrogenase (ubiquinone) Fe-S protein 1
VFVFASEIAGEGSLGMTNRGVGVEVGTFVPKLLRSEMSGNLIDLCPVGALTSKPYAFKARPWELVDTDTVDTMDSLGSNIRVQTRGNDVLRLLPVKNDSINQDWITDKSRFCLDAFNVDRAPTLDDNSDLLLSLVDNIDVSSEGGATIQFVLGSAVDTETVFAARSFASRFSANPVLMADTKGRLNVDWDGS